MPLPHALRGLAVGALALSMGAAAPTNSTPPDGIDFEMIVTTGASGTIEGATDTGAVNVWTHFSTHDPETCSSASPDNRCDKTLVWVEDDGELTFTLDAAYDVADYDLVVWESGKSGSAFNEAGRNITNVTPPGLGQIPIPGDETVTFEAKAQSYYLAVVFYRAAGGGYTLTGELA